MRDLACGPPLTPEAPVAAAARGPIRFSLDAVPERERPAIYREFIGRWVCGLDIEPLRDTPFDADMRVWKLPGLQVMSGRIYGSCNQRTPEMLADSVHDFTLMVNLGGAYLVSRCGDEIVLDDGEATLLSLAQRFSLTHRPPGDMIAVRIPRARLAPLVAHADDCCVRRIPRGNPALKLLLDYVPMATKAQATAGTDLQHVVAGHIHDLVAVALGATRDAAQAARDGGVRAAQLHAIKQDIAGNLARADLSVAALAARHRCTRVSSSGCSRPRARRSPRTCWRSGWRTPTACWPIRAAPARRSRRLRTIAASAISPTSIAHFAAATARRPPTCAPGCCRMRPTVRGDRRRGR